jgi:hypothetical protein
VQIDDANVRSRVARRAGRDDGLASPEYPYVAVPMTTGRLAVTGAGGP